jgi:hypothetical protein
MSFECRCPHCRIPHTFLDAVRERQVRCKNCQAVFRATDRVETPFVAPTPRVERSKKVVFEEPSDIVPFASSDLPSVFAAPAPGQGPVRFSIAIVPPPHEKGGWFDAQKRKQRRGFVYTPEPVDLEELRERDAEGDHSGPLALGMAGLGVVTLLLLIGVVFWVLFRQVPDTGVVVPQQGVVPAQAPIGVHPRPFPQFVPQPFPNVPRPAPPPVFPPFPKRPR